MPVMLLEFKHQGTTAEK